MPARRPRPLGDELADVVDRELAERACTERRDQPLAAGNLVAGPRAGLQVRPAASEPALPIPAERRLRVAHFVALDLVDQPASGISSRSLAREAALGRLGPVAAAVDEAPADAVRRPVRIDAAAAAVASGVGAPGGGGDLSERLVERTGGVIGRKAAGALTTFRVAPADLPTAAMEPDAHAYPRSVVAYPQGVVRRWVPTWVFVT
jgi:hypothetical protein